MTPRYHSYFPVCKRQAGSAGTMGRMDQLSRDFHSLVIPRINISRFEFRIQTLLGLILIKSCMTLLIIIDNSEFD